MRGAPDNHIATAVFDLTVKGSMHLVDPTACPAALLLQPLALEALIPPSPALCGLWVPGRIPS